MKDEALILSDLVASLHEAAAKNVWAPCSGDKEVITFRGEPQFGPLAQTINQCLVENGLPPAKLPSHAEYWA